MKPMENLSQDSHSQCRDVNPGPSENEVKVLNTRPRRSVPVCSAQCFHTGYICLRSRMVTYSSYQIHAHRSTTVHGQKLRIIHLLQR
jgi:hypothetical protein